MKYVSSNIGCWTAIRRLSLALTCAVGLASCERRQDASEPTGAGAAPPQALTAHQPPFEDFRALETLVAGLEAPASDAGHVDRTQGLVPDALRKPWRIMMLQERPRPRERPVWQTIEIQASGMLDLPAESRWRCLYNPVQLEPRIEESGELEAWSASRTVRCSNDGWQTHIESGLMLHMDLEGHATVPIEQMELFLRDNHGDRPLEIAILMRTDERRRPRPILGPEGLRRQQAAQRAAEGAKPDSPHD